MFLGPVESAQLQIRPVDEIAENRNGERVNGGRDENLAIGTVQVGSLNLLSDGVGPVEHVVVVIDGQAARLRQILTDDGLLHGTGHCGTENLSVRSESAGQIELDKLISMELKRKSIQSCTDLPQSVKNM